LPSGVQYTEFGLHVLGLVRPELRSHLFNLGLNASHTLLKRWVDTLFIVDFPSGLCLT
jgi:hypothetical protein